MVILNMKLATVTASLYFSPLYLTGTMLINNTPGLKRMDLLAIKFYLPESRWTWRLLQQVKISPV